MWEWYYFGLVKEHSHSETVTIGRLAWLAEVKVGTVRFYERSGLLEPQERTSAGYRLYSRNTLARIQFICRAREIGYNLGQIKQILLLHDLGGSKETVMPFAASMLAEIDERMRALAKWRQLFTDVSDHFERSNTDDIDGETVDTLMRGQCNKASH